jgi:hypothetical protein
LECSTILYYFGTLSSGEVSKSFKQAIYEYFMMLDDVTTWYPKQDVSGSISVEEIDTGGDNADGIQDTDTSTRESAKAAPYIAAAAGALALLLLIILFVRRSKRNNEDEVSHLKLEDDGDETFIAEIESDAGSPKREYESRDIHVVGEADSVISHWTGYTKRPLDDTFEEDPATGRLGHVSTDVHQCSSATCDVCERNRQRGVTFLSTESPSHPRSIPSDASREYAASDTVSL